MTYEMQIEGCSRIDRIGLDEIAKRALNANSCIWQNLDGTLVDLSTTTDTTYDTIKSEINALQKQGACVYYGFAYEYGPGVIMHNYLVVSNYPEDWSEELIDCDFDKFPNTKAAFAYVCSPMTFGSFDAGSIYVMSVNGVIRRLLLNQILAASN